jgi:hypothetical protein
MDYGPEERIKLATTMKHSVQTSPAYLSVVLAEPLTAKGKKRWLLLLRDQKVQNKMLMRIFKSYLYHLKINYNLIIIEWSFMFTI